MSIFAYLARIGLDMSWEFSFDQILFAVFVILILGQSINNYIYRYIV